MERDLLTRGPSARWLLGLRPAFRAATGRPPAASTRRVAQSPAFALVPLLGPPSRPWPGGGRAVRVRVDYLPRLRPSCPHCFGLFPIVPPPLLVLGLLAGRGRQRPPRRQRGGPLGLAVGECLPPSRDRFRAGPLPCLRRCPLGRLNRRLCGGALSPLTNCLIRREMKNP